MSGILDSKSRVMDTMVTQEGRRQIAQGKLRIEYVSYSDGSTFYKADIASGSADATQRIYLEQCNLPQDQITFEADDSGRLQPFKNTDGTQVKNGQILEYSFDATDSELLTGSNQGVTFLSGDAFASQAASLIASSPDNFAKLYAIATHDKVFDDDGFGVGQKNIEFVITDEKPVPDKTHRVANINDVDSLYNDVRLSHVSNFRYLPPLNKVVNESIDTRDHRETSDLQLGNYKPWGRTHLPGLSPKQIEFELKYFADTGYMRTVTFDPTSRENRLVGQFFEVHNNVLRKLDVIEYGSYSVSKSRKSVFFVGKITTDQNGTNVFVHIFTLVFG